MRASLLAVAKSIYYNLCVAACTLSPTKKTRREAPSVFPLLAGRCAATRRLDVVAFIYNLTRQIFWSSAWRRGLGTRLFSYRTEKKLQPTFSLEQRRWLPLKPLIFRQKGTQRKCLRLPSLTYWAFIPASRVCTGVYGCSGTRGYVDVKTKFSGIDRFQFAINVRMGASGAPLRADAPPEYISSTSSLFSRSSLHRKGRRCSRILQLIRAWAQLTNTIFLDFFNRPLNLWMLPKLVRRN